LGCYCKNKHDAQKKVRNPSSRFDDSTSDPVTSKSIEMYDESEPQQEFGQRVVSLLNPVFDESAAVRFVELSESEESAYEWVTDHVEFVDDRGVSPHDAAASPHSSQGLDKSERLIESSRSSYDVAQSAELDPLEIRTPNIFGLSSLLEPPSHSTTRRVSLVSPRLQCVNPIFEHFPLTVSFMRHHSGVSALQDHEPIQPPCATDKPNRPTNEVDCNIAVDSRRVFVLSVPPAAFELPSSEDAEDVEDWGWEYVTFENA
jgi:hypothetical protein